MKDKDLNTDNNGTVNNIDPELLAFFIEESKELLEDLTNIGTRLASVRIPNEEESLMLLDFAQKLNRLIGGTASMGFTMFTKVSRNTSILAEKCAEIKDMPIRILILNLNNIVKILKVSLDNIESIRDIENQIPGIEQRIDICMSGIGIYNPVVEGQDNIDDFMEKFEKPKKEYQKKVDELFSTLNDEEMQEYVEEEGKLQKLLELQSQSQDHEIIFEAVAEYNIKKGNSVFKQLRDQISELEHRLFDEEIDVLVDKGK